MLIHFTAGNYRSFRDPATLNMVAAKLRSKDERLDRNNVFLIDSEPALLTSAVIYGRNASGKSNLIKALAFMRSFVINSSANTASIGSIDVEPYRLSTMTVDKPSLFEVAILVEGTRYRYGFEATTERVTAEWLYTVPKSYETLLFQREYDAIKLGRSFKEGRDRERLTRPNALFLTVLAQFNAPLGQKLVRWFRQLRVASGISDQGMRIYTQHRLLGGHEVETIIRIVTALDTGIDGLRVEKGRRVDQPSFPSGMPEELRTALTAVLNHPEIEQVSVNTSHTIFDVDGQAVDKTEFDLDEQESEGTKKIFALAGPLSEALAHGQVLCIDEFDARLHPLLTRSILGLFNDLATNPKHAQLVVVTHDIGLLDNELLRRDQIWFVEKDSKGASSLYSLAEFRGVRNDKDYARGYLDGRYGAIPYVHQLAEAVAVYETDNAKTE